MVPGRVEWVIHREAKVVLIQLDQGHLELLREPKFPSKLVSLELVVTAEHCEQELKDLKY